MDASADATAISNELQNANPTDTTTPPEQNDALLQTRILPPSHILPTGQYIHLPPPTPIESSSFFERAAASHHLIQTDESRPKKKTKKNKQQESTFIHPLSVASARLRGKGIDELSKAINLGTLVQGGEYFALTNVVVHQQHMGEEVDEKEKKRGDMDESTVLFDGRMRSTYVLRKYRCQYGDASIVLARRSKRLLSSLSGRRVLDARLRSLRRRWRLVAPERRPGGMVRARDVVAVDVEVYDCLGGAAATAVDASSFSEGRTLGRIARRVPRFATMELEEGYDVSSDVKLLKSKVQNVWNELKGGNNSLRSTNETVTDKPSAMEVDDETLKQQCLTKAEPFATADPTLGTIDPDFDPDKVPLLTLLFEIEKPSTGFVQRASLSSLFSLENNQHNSPPDERVIESLQHSLFCASLFESMRAEIIPPPTQSSTHTQQRNESVAWLSSEMDESFLPPPSMMAGRDSLHTGESRLLCVVHCHEGELKVQLDDEYCLTAKLIEVGTTIGAAKNNHDSCVTQDNDIVNDSGSESPARLQALCKALLLHSQSLYHEHRMMTQMDGQNDSNDAVKPVGLARTKKEKKKISPHILQSCVGLGCKFIFEKKIRAVLKRISIWLESAMKCKSEMKCQWLPLAVFDLYSQFTLLFRDLCLDVKINGDLLGVTQSTPSGEFRSASFGSDAEFECFLKLELRRTIAKTS